MKKILNYTLLLLVMFTLIQCGRVEDVSMCLQTTESPSGFWVGVWDGLTLPFSIIGRLFSDISIYDVNNNGRFYDLGFVIGTGGLAFWLRTIFR